MQVEFEISNIRDKVDVGGLSQPVIGQRKVSHIIRVREGEVTLIGGLMQATQTKVRSGLPGLMNLPFSAASSPPTALRTSTRTCWSPWCRTSCVDRR